MKEKNVQESKVSHTKKDKEKNVLKKERKEEERKNDKTISLYPLDLPI